MNSESVAVVEGFNREPALPGAVSEAYDALVKRLKRKSALDQAAGLLRWDQETYMPEGGTEARAHQLSALDTASHEQFTDPETGGLLDQAEAEASTETQRALLREVRWAYDRAVRVPDELVEETSQATSRALSAWVKAKQESDFEAFQPHLEEIVELRRRYAEHVDPEEDPYAVLFAEHEPWLDHEAATRVLGELRDRLVPLIEAAPEPSHRPDEVFGEPWPIVKQQEMLEDLLDALGYPRDRGRLDLSAHPFSTGTPYDARITTRLHEDDVVSGLTSTIHEFGHALYTLGLPTEHFGTPLGQARDLVAHESQSRLWENHVGRSRGFWTWFLPLLREHFPARAQGLSVEAAWRAANVVEPTPIRVDADELTYHLHIVLRTEIEQELVRGELDVAQAPARWDELTEAYLGLTPENDREGILQDVHWSHGSIGYFPTYSLGSLLAAQLAATFEAKHGPLGAVAQEARFDELATWLQEKVHRHGKRYTTPELIRTSTGAELGADAFIGYAEGKYGELWGEGL